MKRFFAAAALCAALGLGGCADPATKVVSQANPSAVAGKNKSRIEAIVIDFNVNDAAEKVSGERALIEALGSSNVKAAALNRGGDSQLTAAMTREALGGRPIRYVLLVERLGQGTDQYTTMNRYGVVLSQRSMPAGAYRYTLLDLESKQIVWQGAVRTNGNDYTAVAAKASREAIDRMRSDNII